MFKNPFKSTSPDQNHQDFIHQYLENFKSEVFPNGVLSALSSFTIAQNKNTYDLQFGLLFPCQGELEEIARQLVLELDIDIELTLSLQTESVRSHSIAGIKNIIAVASGKGGVGKSTTTVNLAYALMAEGAKVAVLDADIYGPSIPTMLGIEGQRPSSLDGKLMQPINASGLQAMSIGLLVSESDATVWRGPMASSAFSQLLNETNWQSQDGEEIDYLLIDMPPGTGDIQLTLAQKVPVAAAVIVTTPQNIALKDAVKGISMFDKVNVPVLGVVENMSFHICDNCGHHANIFGSDGGKQLTINENVPLLGQLPLQENIRVQADSGNSLLTLDSASEISTMYRKIARRMAAELFYQLDLRSPNAVVIETINEI